MLRQLLDGASLYDLPLIAMGIFVAMFLTVLVRAAQKSRQSEYRRMAGLPLQNDTDARSRP